MAGSKQAYPILIKSYLLVFFNFIYNAKFAYANIFSIIIFIELHLMIICNLKKKECNSMLLRVETIIK